MYSFQKKPKMSTYRVSETPKKCYTILSPVQCTANEHNEPVIISFRRKTILKVPHYSTEEPYPHKSSRLGNNIRLVLNNLFWISSSFVRKQKSWRDLGRLLLRQKISICFTCQTKVVKNFKKSRVKILKKVSKHAYPLGTFFSVLWLFN